ncbi:type IV conjugative transfer system protein TraE [Pantoea sp. M_9]|uniref:type IV conjugative transfer system protein TraE n=1 Tax=Pantoea sp. M_9 TaxID=2608041 RepID=UPI00123223D8|nr:type IV conjugative transfer system protein TraE [Pantoea sp. M_9]KAA5971653.1 type IV conjugative transfer system protein TraE [Pantoea sp. M_9]
MTYSAHASRTRLIAAGYAILGGFFLLALIAVILLILDNRRLAYEQKMIVTPMGYNAPFAVSDNAASPAYLEMYAVAALAMRLNVSPGTIHEQHQLLLSLFRPGAQPEMKVKLAGEAEQIVRNDVDSNFIPTAIRVYPHAAQIDIRGQLTTWIGSGKPTRELRHYAMQYEHRDGHTWLTRFIEVQDEQ